LVLTIDAEASWGYVPKLERWNDKKAVEAASRRLDVKQSRDGSAAWMINRAGTALPLGC